MGCDWCSFQSWKNQRAKTYRKLNNTLEWGTAVNVNHGFWKYGQ